MNGQYPGMGPGRPSRPSELAMNRDNDRARARRRADLLAAFDSLDPNTRASLLEAAETWAFGGNWSPEKDEARTILRQMYAAAGWHEEYLG